MPVYTFGGGVVQPALLQYIAYLQLNANLVLNWPSSFLDSPNVIAVQNDVEAIGTNLTVALPSALQVGVGTSFFFNNVGPNPFGITDTGGDLLWTLNPGIIVYFYLIDNSTADGSWRVYIFGAGTSEAQAQQLAGYGLIALARTPPNPDALNVYMDVSTVTMNQTVDALSMSSFYVCTQPISLGVPTGVLSGLFFAATNQSNGIVNIVSEGGAEINGSLDNLSLLPSQTAWLITDGTNWFSQGTNQYVPSTARILNFPLQNGIFAYVIPDVSMQSNNVVVFNGSNSNQCFVSFAPTNGEWTFQNLCSFQITIKVTGGSNTFVLAPNDVALLYGNAALGDLYAVPTTSIPLPIEKGGTGEVTAVAAFDELAPTTMPGDMIFRGSTTNERLAAAAGTNLGASLVCTDMGAGGRPRWDGMGNLSISQYSNSTAAVYTYAGSPITQTVLTGTITKKAASSNIIITGAICVGLGATASTIVTVAVVRNGATTIAFVGSLGGNTSTNTMLTVPIYCVDTGAAAVGVTLTYTVEVSFSATGSVGINQPVSGVPALGPTTSTLVLTEVGNSGGWNA